jgi:hypothetical protein
MYTPRLDGNHRDADSTHKHRREAERIEDAEPLAKRHRHARPHAKHQTGRPQIRQAAGIHEPPVNGAVHLKKKPPNTTAPQTEATDKNNNPEKI